MLLNVLSLLKRFKILYTINKLLWVFQCWISKCLLSVFISLLGKLLNTNILCERLIDILPEFHIQVPKIYVGTYFSGSFWYHQIWISFCVSFFARSSACLSFVRKVSPAYHQKLSTMSQHYLFYFIIIFPSLYRTNCSGLMVYHTPCLLSTQISAFRNIKKMKSLFISLSRSVNLK